MEASYHQVLLIRWSMGLYRQQKSIRKDLIPCLVSDALQRSSLVLSLGEEEEQVAPHS